jgi:hypothetical protein
MERLRVERGKQADRLGQWATWLPVIVSPLALIAIVDLAIGWADLGLRADVVALGVFALSVISSFQLRRLAGQMRAGFPTPHRPVLRVATSIAGMILLLVGSGVGAYYLLGGWVPAIVIPLATVFLMASSTALGIRRRRRILAGR